MEPQALTIIRDEHQALAAMLRSLAMMLSLSRREGQAPDFGVLRAMLFYIDEFPERLHHPKEAELLFPRVRQHCPELGAVLDRLGHDHQQGEAAIRTVQHALLAYEVMGETHRVAFEEALSRYTQFYLAHMALEEQQVLPAARQHLSPADWDVLNAAFARNQDPLTGHPPSAPYQALFTKILHAAPAPIGLGQANRAAAAG